MSSKPLVSVNMITYNHELYIAQAIEGVINQKTNFPFELVIGEDCSTDNTRKIILDYQSRYPGIIKVIMSDNNVGMLNNSSRSIKACSGKYLAFCEGDDYWHNLNKLQIQVDFLEKHPDYVFTHSNQDVYDVLAGIVRKCNYSSVLELGDDGVFEQIITRKRKVATLTVCARTDAIMKVITDNEECFDSKYFMGDLQLWLELSRLGLVKFIPESLATYRQLPESMCNSQNPNKTLLFELNVEALIGHYLKKYNCTGDVEIKATAQHCFNVYKAALIAKNEKTALEYKNKLSVFCLLRVLSFNDYVLYWRNKNNFNSRIYSIVSNCIRPIFKR